MSSSAGRPMISVRGLGKAFTIRHHAEHHVTLAEQALHRMRHPLQRQEREQYWAIEDLSFDVAEGEVLGVIGRNGAGKSTLLKLLARITPPTKGEIELYGRIGSLLEVGTGFHPELTGRENVYLNGSILGMRKREIDRQFDAIVDFAGVEQFLDTPVKRYSSGMYVRLAFAVAAHLDTEILLVDEVLAVGDADFQARCADKIRAVCAGRPDRAAREPPDALDRHALRPRARARGGQSAHDRSDLGSDRRSTSKPIANEPGSACGPVQRWGSGELRIGSGAPEELERSRSTGQQGVPLRRRGRATRASRGSSSLRLLAMPTALPSRIATRAPSASGTRPTTFAPTPRAGSCSTHPWLHPGQLLDRSLSVQRRRHRFVRAGVLVLGRCGAPLRESSGRRRDASRPDTARLSVLGALRRPHGSRGGVRRRRMMTLLGVVLRTADGRRGAVGPPDRAVDRGALPARISGRCRLRRGRVARRVQAAGRHRRVRHRRSVGPDQHAGAAR